MADPKDESFFRKVVRFVANPATDWSDLNSRQPEDGALEIERSELKAMVERKRRNDFVRKREFDMLRKLRREGLSPEQLAALGGSSRLDDSDARVSEHHASARPEGGVKAKIDEIEQQMVGSGRMGASTRPGTVGDTRAGPLSARTTMPAVMDNLPHPGRTRPGALPPAEPPLPRLEPERPAGVPSHAVMAPGLPPLSGSQPVPAEWPPRTPVPASPPAAHAPGGPQTDFGGAFAVEVSEAVHDPELDEAVIAFANADFAQCEDSLAQLTGSQGSRLEHGETWLVLFDLYRATGQQNKFEQLAVEYAQRFGWSAPQWFSMPRLVAEAAAANDRPATLRSATPAVGWTAPALLDAEAVVRLRAQTLQMPLPWVFDWAPLQQVDAEAAVLLSGMFRQWAEEPLDMRWMGGDRLLQVLAEAAPTGVRDADPAYWVARLDALRLANRADQFDEVAIDYCVTYEVSPPSWERVRCKLRLRSSGHSTQAPSMSQVSEVSTSFLESGLLDDAHGVQMATVELSGQLVSDIGPTLRVLDQQLGSAAVVTVNCNRLIRVDFIAAGDLLNWVLAKRSENREVVFADAHRLVALFFGAMGINEHARVKVRNN
ncbi:MAG: STAS domain-containing protein [Aquincola tertiaricarbonis]|uniref:STAS domain-containing protein n=1 Tax=Aquincola tertiaricarbonis TaxID=391953 RepID=UPI0006149C2B|nr:STAS domain-containing protein [Aquincola tertiaricarbonis]